MNAMLFRLPSWPKAAADFLKEWDNPDIQSFTFQTSGTTGPSKQITLDREQIIAAAYSSQIPLGWQEGQRAGLALTASGIGGKMVLVRGRCYNMEVIPLELRFQRDHESLLARGAEEWTGYLDHLSLVPVQALALLQYWTQHGIHPASRVGTLLLGGGPLPADLERFLSEDHLWKSDAGPSSFQIIHGLGMTETAGHFALRTLYPVWERAYTPLPGIHCQLEPLHRDKITGRGTLVISGAVTKHRPLVTREILQWGTQVGQLEWVGRADLVIQSGGNTLLVDEIESKMHRILHSCSAQTTALDPWKFLSQTNWYLGPWADPVWGERITLCIPQSLWRSLNNSGHLKSLKAGDWSAFLPTSSWPRAIAPVPQSCFDQPGKTIRVAIPVAGLEEPLTLG